MVIRALITNRYVNGFIDAEVERVYSAKFTAGCGGVYAKG